MEDDENKGCVCVVLCFLSPKSACFCKGVFKFFTTARGRMFLLSSLSVRSQSGVGVSGLLFSSSLLEDAVSINSHLLSPAVNTECVLDVLLVPLCLPLCHSVHFVFLLLGFHCHAG